MRRAITYHASGQRKSQLATARVLLNFGRAAFDQLLLSTPYTMASQTHLSVSHVPRGPSAWSSSQTNHPLNPVEYLFGPGPSTAQQWYPFVICNIVIESRVERSASLRWFCQQHRRHQHRRWHPTQPQDFHIPRNPTAKAL